jgi:hypothetical protein
VCLWRGLGIRTYASDLLFSKVSTCTRAVKLVP